MAIYRPVLFLALVAVFSFYAAFSGYRVLKLKDLPRGGQGKTDRLVCRRSFTFCSAVPAWPIVWRIVQADLGAELRNRGRGVRAAGHAAGSGADGPSGNCTAKPKEKMFWWYTHLGNFIGSYIAAWTAFSAVTLSQFVPHGKIYVWLWPSAIGVPAIYWTVGYYQRKFAPKPKTPLEEAVA